MYFKGGLVRHWKKVRHDRPLLKSATWEANVDGVMHPIMVLFDAECEATLMTRSAANRIGLKARNSRPLMMTVTNIDGREEIADHHYKLVVRDKNGEDVIVYPHSVSMIWEFSPPGELPEDIAERMSVRKGGLLQQPTGPFDLVIGHDDAELLPRCLARSESVLCGDRLWLYESPVSDRGQLS